MYNKQSPYRLTACIGDCCTFSRQPTSSWKPLGACPASTRRSSFAMGGCWAMGMTGMRGMPWKSSIGCSASAAG
jgi:hypothetical protein